MARLGVVLTAILALVQQPCLAYPRAHHASRVFLNGRDVDEQYDYIIVGGGTAGLTVADRLTEDGKTTVLVVEYGQLSNSIFHTLPSYVPSLTLCVPRQL